MSSRTCRPEKLRSNQLRISSNGSDIKMKPDLSSLINLYPGAHINILVVILGYDGLVTSHTSYSTYMQYWISAPLNCRFFDRSLSEGVRKCCSMARIF